MTVIINNPWELTKVMEICRKHCIASEAKINQDKTQIFTIGRRYNNEPEDFKQLVTDKVTILGNIFCRTNSLETEENLKKASKILTKPTSNNFNSLIGKIININTYVYSTIWNAAWLIDTNCKPFAAFEKKVARYLQIIKHQEVYESVTREKNQGGLNLINLKDRIIAIKTKLTIEAIEQKSETDNYNIPTRNTC